MWPDIAVEDDNSPHPARNGDWVQRGSDAEEADTKTHYARHVDASSEWESSAKFIIHRSPTGN